MTPVSRTCSACCILLLLFGVAASEDTIVSLVSLSEGKGGKALMQTLPSSVHGESPAVLVVSGGAQRRGEVVEQASSESLSEPALLRESDELVASHTVNFLPELELEQESRLAEQGLGEPAGETVSTVAPTVLPSPVSPSSYGSTQEIPALQTSQGGGGGEATSTVAGGQGGGNVGNTPEASPSEGPRIEVRVVPVPLPPPSLPPVQSAPPSQQVDLEEIAQTILSAMQQVNATNNVTITIGDGVSGTSVIVSPAANAQATQQAVGTTSNQTPIQQALRPDVTIAVDPLLLEDSQEGEEDPTGVETGTGDDLTDPLEDVLEAPPDEGEESSDDEDPVGEGAAITPTAESEGTAGEVEGTADAAQGGEELP